MKYYGPDDDLSNQTVELAEATVFESCKSMVNTAIITNGLPYQINCADPTTTVDGVAIWA